MRRTDSLLFTNKLLFKLLLSYSPVQENKDEHTPGFLIYAGALRLLFFNTAVYKLISRNSLRTRHLNSNRPKSSDGRLEFSRDPIFINLWHLNKIWLSINITNCRFSIHNNTEFPFASEFFSNTGLDYDLPYGFIFCRF